MAAHGILLTTPQAGGSDQSSRQDGYEKYLVCSSAKTLKTIISPIISWELHYPKINCFAKPAGASQVFDNPTSYAVLSRFALVPLDL